MSINLEEYSSILKESAYILGDCSLIDDLNIEVIDWQLGNIGANMKSLLKEKKEIINILCQTKNQDNYTILIFSTYFNKSLKPLSTFKCPPFEITI